jgi:hypothetical protein
MRALFLAFFVAVTLPRGTARAADPEKGAAALSLLKAMDEGFVQVYEKVAPTVVVIEASKHPEEDDRDTIKGRIRMAAARGRGVFPRRPLIARAPGSLSGRTALF